MDLEAAWDGPVIDQENGVKYPIDDLVICHACAQAIADLLPDQAERLRFLEERAKNAEERLKAQTAYSASLEQALAAKRAIAEGLSQPPPRRRGRPRNPAVTAA